MKNIIVGDLFGGSQNSVYHSLKHLKNIVVYTFDINDKKEHEHQYKIDLSNIESFVELIDKENIPYPQFIFASPLCTSFSLLQNYKDERVCGTKKDNEGVLREFEQVKDILSKSKFGAHYDPNKYYDGGVLGGVLLKNSIKIIEMFKPYGGYIENPQTSLMGKVIKDNYKTFGESTYENVAHYNSYDLSFSKKPTTFLSNKELRLKRYNIQGNIKIPKGARMKGSSNNEQGERVKIPHLLIIDIFKQMLEE